MKSIDRVIDEVVNNFITEEINQDEINKLRGGVSICSMRMLKEYRALKRDYLDFGWIYNFIVGNDVSNNYYSYSLMTSVSKFMFGNFNEIEKAKDVLHLYSVKKELEESFKSEVYGILDRYIRNFDNAISCIGETFENTPEWVIRRHIVNDTVNKLMANIDLARFCHKGMNECAVLLKSHINVLKKNIWYIFKNVLLEMLIGHFLLYCDFTYTMMFYCAMMRSNDMKQYSTEIIQRIKDDINYFYKILQ